MYLQEYERRIEIPVDMNNVVIIVDYVNQNRANALPVILIRLF